MHNIAIAAVRTSIDLCDLVLVSINRTRSFNQRVRNATVESLGKLEKSVGPAFSKRRRISKTDRGEVKSRRASRT